MSLLDHIPFEKVNPPVTEKIGRLRAASVSNQSFSMGTTVGIGGGFTDGYNTKIIKDRVKNPVLRAMLKVLWDLLAEIAKEMNFSYTTAYVNKNFSNVPHVDKKQCGYELGYLDRAVHGRAAGVRDGRPLCAARPQDAATPRDL
jgi:hypothetical protein